MRVPDPAYAVDDTMDLPKEIRKALEMSQKNLPDSGIDIPDLDMLERSMIGVRDSFAKAAGVEPEEVKLVGVRVYYSIKEVTEGAEEVIMIAQQSRYHPDYGEMLEESENR